MYVFEISYTWVSVNLSLTGQFADKPSRGQASRGLDTSQTSQLADSKFLKSWN